MLFEDNLKKSGIELPDLLAPAGNYVHGILSGNLLFLSGKGPGSFSSNGKVGKDISTEQAYKYARKAGLYLLSAMKHELGTLNRVNRIVKVFGMVNAIPEFTDHPKVINGCSDLLIEIFGKHGHHARSAMGVGSLPGNMVVEIEAIVEIKEFENNNIP